MKLPAYTVPLVDWRARNRQRTAEYRKVWQPSDAALSVFKHLKFLEGQHVIIQLWDDLMELLPDEGTLPFSCELLRVFTASIKEDDRDFTQLFVEFKNSTIINNGNVGGKPNFESMFDQKSGTYTYNCSLFAWVEEDIEPALKNICTFTKDNEQQIIANLE